MRVRNPTPLCEKVYKGLGWRSPRHAFAWSRSARGFIYKDFFTSVLCLRVLFIHLLFKLACIPASDRRSGDYIIAFSCEWGSNEIYSRLTYAIYYKERQLKCVSHKMGKMTNFWRYLYTVPRVCGFKNSRAQRANEHRKSQKPNTLWVFNEFFRIEFLGCNVIFNPA